MWLAILLSLPMRPAPIEVDRIEVNTVYKLTNDGFSVTGTEVSLKQIIFWRRAKSGEYFVADWFYFGDCSVDQNNKRLIYKRNVYITKHWIETETLCDRERKDRDRLQAKDRLSYLAEK